MWQSACLSRQPTRLCPVKTKPNPTSSSLANVTLDAVNGRKVRVSKAILDNYEKHQVTWNLMMILISMTII